jgi:hypothetical protein
MAQKVPFIVAELGKDADPFMLHLYALKLCIEAAAAKGQRQEASRQEKSTTVAA